MAGQTNIGIISPFSVNLEDHWLH